MGQWQSLSLGGLLLLLLEVLTSANVWNQTDSSFYEVIIPKQLGLDKGKGYKDDCYYHGYVEGFNDSLVGLSTCYGLRGFLQFRNLSYGIEPLESSYNFQHLIYQTEYMYSEDLYSESMSCGMNYANQNMYSKRFFHDLKLKVSLLTLSLIASIPDIQSEWQVHLFPTL
ncbi:disintegrin and metalloproteinase domain-containing protein 2-like isoform X3 [Rhinatrema bivittatum]|uniref:disintegrin and metalloproteinase domain-containing protein 2-like isoform X3 n=1 Tax=Rhinatrema bivittatum TaxID=194408 RepID=UPI00112D68C5|nr:disintegrin and metalloproteinase domain-containing protein 2-like isoform X3 [Rhinatrema bivittatum]